MLVKRTRPSSSGNTLEEKVSMATKLSGNPIRSTLPSKRFVFCFDLSIFYVFVCFCVLSPPFFSFDGEGFYEIPLVDLSQRELSLLVACFLSRNFDVRVDSNVV